MKTTTGREQIRLVHEFSRGGSEREIYVETFKNGTRQLLEEERKSITELIIQAQNLSYDQVTPKEQEKLLSSLWARRRAIEVRIANL